MRVIKLFKARSQKSNKYLQVRSFFNTRWGGGRGGCGGREGAGIFGPFVCVLCNHMISISYSISYIVKSEPMR